ncbi:dihydrofolate reductase [Candidatus Pacearchaeota archaeon]|nr:dihydrofolate reductase [Candidatus Pacearchaeota archaeon]
MPASLFIVAIISLIATIDDKRGISKGGKLPEEFKKALTRLTKLTKDQPVLMGRKTYELIGSLPQSQNFVLSKNAFYLATGAEVITEVDQILEFIDNDDDIEIFIIGGSTLYDQAIEIADKLYLTRIDGTFDADLFFPKLSEDEWEIIETTKEEGYTQMTLLNVKANIF